ncbi:39 kDa FK506-binding nuclear protein-like, partial [Sitodiplosis mosellana]|uniref:39 kDa FK506-binding nuclear protein-like n=1 Tax=Sitodiplosis mosellana TaxID=263140 RepID=UPI00244405E0
IQLDAQKRLNKTRVEKNFKVSKAVLDLETFDDDQDGCASIWVAADGKHTLLANLSRNIPQTTIDVAFGKGQTVEFYMRATFESTAYLSGYYVLDDENSSDESSDEKSQPEFPNIKLPKFPQYQSNEHQLLHMSPSIRQGGHVKTPQNAYAGYHSDMKMDVSPKFNAYKGKGDMGQAPTIPRTPRKTALAASKLLNDLKDTDETGDIENDDFISAKKPKFSATQGPQELPGGVIIEDTLDGTGTIVEKNSTVKFKYTVRPAKGNARSQPMEMELTLGKRKSLLCWNIGIPGMKVGGIRQITSPSSHAYGHKGIVPFIGGDEDVVFVIQLFSSK